MLPKKIVILVILISFLHVNCDKWNHTCSLHDDHVNTSLFRNVSCTQSRDEKSKVHGKCELKTTTELEQVVFCPGIIYSMDMSNNQIEEIEDDAFFKYKEMNLLDLSHNKIKSISQKAFDGLGKLRILDLRFNDIATWNTKSISQQTPFIKEINIAANPPFHLEGKDFANLKNLKIIGIFSYTLPYGGLCGECDLKSRGNSFIGLSHNQSGLRYTFLSSCFRTVMSFYGDNVNDFKNFFSMACRLHEGERHFCKNSRFGGPWSQGLNFSVEVFDDCLPGINKWAFPNILSGLVAMVFSAITMTTIFSSKSLRKNVSMFFIATMTIGDLLLGIWLVIISTTRLCLSSLEFETLKRSWFCKVIFFLFLSSQIWSVSVAFLVTLERYICIEYSSKPTVRITKVIAKKLMMFVFSLVVLGGSLIFGLHMKPGGDYSCINVSIPNDDRKFLDYIGALGVFVYILCYILYARLFYIVRKSTLNVGIHREGRTAKRIIIVISTNVLFFLGPIIAGQVLLRFDLLKYVKSFVFWNADSIFFLGVNSCLNPIIYAFYDGRFRNELKKHLRCNTRRNVITVRGIEK